MERLKLMTEKLHIPKTWYKRVTGPDYRMVWRKCHKVQEIAEGNDLLTVYKWYSKSRGRWMYDIEGNYTLFHYIKTMMEHKKSEEYGENS